MRPLGRHLAERVLSGLVAPASPPEPRARGADLVRAEGLVVELGGRPVLGGVEVGVRAGELVALVGPNGAGKTTLLAALAGDVARAGGRVEVAGRSLDDWAPLDLARRRAVLPQQVQLGFPFLVEEVVAMGRSPWAGTDAEDRDAAVVAAALEEADATHLIGRRFPTLSGGERARVALARVLAQSTQLLLLDEPTAALDVHHQELVLGALRARVDAGAGVVVVLHDLGLASAHADRVVVVAGGRVEADGPAAEVLTGPRLTAVYAHPIEVLPHPRTGAPLVVPVRV
jgi:iron complex transport system ATP-binding protein